MLLLYCQKLTPRLQYIVNFFSAEIFDTPIRITADKEAYAASEGARLNYSPETIIEGEFMVVPTSLLFESGIRPQATTCFEAGFYKAFFPASGDLPFDIFAASFYLLTRYEEYLPYEKDVFGRYGHTNSIAFKEGFLHLPLVNNWIQEFKAALMRRFPGMVFKKNTFSNIVTYDIDMAYSYLHKGFIRNLGGAVRSVFRGQWPMLWERVLVLLRLKQDPFDCYELLDALHLYCRLKPYYFFLAAKETSQYDKNLSTDVKAFRNLIEYYAATYHTGIHPSWQSVDNPALLKEELEWMEVVADKKIINSRQHYIRFALPQTYRQLIDAGIRNDFSMGYGSINGFRASVCSSFYWYDLEKDAATDLHIHPFCFMDANAFYEQRYSPGQAYAELMKYYDEVKKTNGMLITIWHNNLLGAGLQTKGWREMFELFMRETVYWDAYCD